MGECFNRPKKHSSRPSFLTSGILQGLRFQEPKYPLGGVNPRAQTSASATGTRRYTVVGGGRTGVSFGMAGNSATGEGQDTRDIIDRHSESPKSITITPYTRGAHTAVIKATSLCLRSRSWTQIPVAPAGPDQSDAMGLTQIGGKSSGALLLLGAVDHRLETLPFALRTPSAHVPLGMA